ncbi:hypothetical protein [Streptomyces albipurpureus]|uniref:Uncharacterized protein n=1 Tax=Streptomyces albipurpureus TaxID=2897419 RepID=A0ABT0UZ84_9ACTN|nr:hypothetical protein [Streptomyces sp. CWNU-1]MCM2393780.1 hypothetical protein [Streptomyces sp. CWNU-1]
MGADLVGSPLSLWARDITVHLTDCEPTPVFTAAALGASRPRTPSTFRVRHSPALGQQPSRTQLAVAFPALLGRLPGGRLPGFESELSSRKCGSVGRIASLPLEW